MHTKVHKAAYYTLGCKLNFSETSAIGRLLEQRGITRAARGDNPDIIVINTCSVTETADKKGRQLIRRLAHRFPEASIVVTGCYAQLKPKEVAEIEGVDIVLGSNEKLRAGEYIDQWLETRQPKLDVTPFREIKKFTPTCERGDRTRYFLKVQDGCDYFCTYCTIPYARGGSRSGEIPELVALAERAAAEGGKEIVLTGINVGEFGRGTDQNFFDLIKALDKVEGIERFRISSIEPNLLTEEMIAWVANESRAFMPHFHIPLQSGSDAVLKKMNRRYDTALFESRIRKVKELIPDAFIGVDIIAGARGETAEEWEKSLAFVDSLPITRLHVFPYSERPGTAALALGDSVDQTEKHRRVSELTRLSDRKFAEYHANREGQEVEVLWEQSTRDGERMHGFTRNYMRITAPYRKELINTLSRVRIVGLDPDDNDSLAAEHI